MIPTKRTTTSRFAAALLLVAASMVMQLRHAEADPCVVFDQACAADAVCSACMETPSTHVDAFEQCVLYYVHTDSICVNQSQQPCCQSEASPTDCLANDAYTDFYDCRLQNDVVGEDCLALNCDAVGTPAPTVLVTVGPTPVGGPVPETDAPTPSPGMVDDDDTDATSTSGARPLAPPLLLTTKNNAATGAIALVTGLSAAVAALF